MAALCLLHAGFVPKETGAAQLEAAIPAEADALLEKMHDYAGRYVSSLPDFLCQLTTDQFEAGKKGEHWKQLDSITSRLVYADGKEHKTVELVNGRKPEGNRLHRRPLTTEGEFAILLANIFGDNSKASFEWKGWEDCQGQRCGVFAYRIEQQNSTMKLSLSDLATATLAYHGEIHGNPADGSVRRVTSEANEIPPEIRTRSMKTVINYWPVTVGNSSYLLPSDALAEIVTPTGRARNELHFRNYQKFQAESTVTFDNDSTPEAKPPSTPPQN